MKILKSCLLPFAFCATSLHGNPKELVYAQYLTREIEWHLWQHDGSKHLRRIFEKLSRGEKVTTEDVKPLFPAGCCIEGIRLTSATLFALMKEDPTGSASDENSIPEKKHDCVLVKFRCWDIPFTLCLKEDGTVAVYIKCKTAAGYIYLTVNKSVPNENQLMKYAYEHYDIFSKHLYALLNKHIRTKWNPSPFATQMRDAFDEQNGYVFNQVVDPVPCFVVNAESTYAFIQKWCLQQSRAGRTERAMTEDLYPVYNLLFKGRKALCDRVREFFRPTVIDRVKNNGIDCFRVRYEEPRKGGKFHVKEVLQIETFGKRIFIMNADYLLLPFLVIFIRRCDSNHENNYERMRYGYD